MTGVAIHAILLFYSSAALSFTDNLEPIPFLNHLS